MAPLTGIRVIEMAGLGPGPFAGMLLADMGADVIRVDRPSHAGGDPQPVLGRGKRSVVLDLKQREGVDHLLQLVATADVLIDVYRPGVAERLGFGPAACLARNPGLVFGRMTGWGQNGPLAPRAGHDIDYIAVAGVLGAIGHPGRPPSPPLNLIGDYGGGALYLVAGVLAALVERLRTGKGQVVDTAMVDGAASLTALFHEMGAGGAWTPQRGDNLLDGGAPFYDVYPTADGRFVAVGALEPQFFAALLDGLDLDPAELPSQFDRARWPELREAIGTALLRDGRDAWEERFAEIDACVAPVLDLFEATHHPANTAREVFVEANGVVQPGPAPRFAGARRMPGPAPRVGEHTEVILGELAPNVPPEIAGFMAAAVAEAEAGLAEGGIPIGSVLVVDGEIVGRGHNRRVQKGSPVLHAEMDCLERAGRLPASVYGRATLFSTLSPCDMCSGAILLYGIPRVVVGEHQTFRGPEAYVASRGVDVVVLDDERCIRLMQDFIDSRPELWNEDIGE